MKKRHMGCAKRAFAIARVSHTGILSNPIWRWLDQVELLRQQVGMRGLAGI
jgi:hypothetical protein